MRVSMSMKRDEAFEFLEYLKEKHPLPDGVEVSLQFINKTNLAPSSLGDTFAWCRINKKTKKVEIEVALRGRSLTEVIRSTGHEYYHAIQWFMKGEFKTLEDGADDFVGYELAAESFGIDESRAFYGL